MAPTNKNFPNTPFGRSAKGHALHDMENAFGFARTQEIKFLTLAYSYTLQIWHKSDR
jgi:hypothetical protein